MYISKVGGGKGEGDGSGKKSEKKGSGKGKEANTPQPQEGRKKAKKGAGKNQEHFPLRPYGNEELVEKVTQLIRQDPVTGEWDGKIYKLPARNKEGQFESLKLQVMREMSPSEAEALSGVILCRSQRAGGKGLSDDAADRLEEALRSDPAHLLKQGAVLGPVLEHWNHADVKVSGEGMKACVYTSKQHLQRGHQGGMHSGKDTAAQTTHALEGSTSAATVEAMQADTLLLACTELPLIADFPTSKTLVDVTDLVADALVARSLAGRDRAAMTPAQQENDA